MRGSAKNNAGHASIRNGVLRVAIRAHAETCKNMQNTLNHSKTRYNTRGCVTIQKHIKPRETNMKVTGPERKFSGDSFKMKDPRRSSPANDTKRQFQANDLKRCFQMESLTRHCTFKRSQTEDPNPKMPTISRPIRVRVTLI